MTDSIHAWYSQKQFNNNIDEFNHNNNCKFPYIYYKLKTGKIVQITEVTAEKKTLF